MALLIGLGTWQLERRGWKQALIAEREAAFALPPLTLSGAAGEAETAAWRRVTVTGTFLHGHETLVGPRSRDGAPGWHVVTPLRLTNGRHVVVDRGWIPQDRKTAAQRPESLVAGTVTVTGILRRPTAPGPFVPDNEPAKEQWFHVDPAALAAAWGVRGVASWWVEAIASPGDNTVPRGVAGLSLPPDNHLQYAITWYSLAVALAVIAVVRLRGARKADGAQ